MTTNNYYPVLIPTLCRFEHFNQCVKSLSACSHADETVLYIALDYPLRDEHWEGYDKILSSIDMIKGFKEVILIQRDRNFGPELNALKAEEVILQNYDAYIFSEDDNVFSPNFLDYMNKCLNVYKNDARIYAVCGYNFPVDFGSYKKNIYFNHLYSAWGVGIWRDKVISFEVATAKKILGSLSQVIRLYYYNPKYILSLLRMVHDNKVYGDLLVCAFSIANNLLNVFPTISKVRNLGHDGSGQHSTQAGQEVFDTQIIDDDAVFYSDLIEIRRLHYRKMDRYQDISVGQKLKLIPKLLIYWIRH